MSDHPIRYRKLPGHRRGIVIGSSLWLGPDHLLLVKSLRVREEYKRYYFRDIKAVAIARTSRFHISTRSLAIAATWFFAQIFASASRLPWAPWLFSTPVALAIIWAFISKKASCRCRIYTAVSADELPSIYRTWTAKALLAIAEPRIRAVQGPLPEGWMTVLEGSAALSAAHDATASIAEAGVVPAAERSGAENAPSPPPHPLAAAAGAHTGAGAPRTRTSDLFLMSLTGAAILDLSQIVLPFRAPPWVFSLAILLVVFIAGAVLVQRFRRVLGPGFDRLALVKLVWCAVQLYIVSPVMTGLALSVHPRAPVPQIADLAGIDVPYNQALFAVDAAANAILAVVGVILIGRSRRPPAAGMFSTEL